MLSAMLLFGVRTFLPALLSKENEIRTETGPAVNLVHGDKMTYFIAKIHLN